MAIRDLPDMYALGLWACISGKSLMAMLQLLHILLHINNIAFTTVFDCDMPLLAFTSLQLTTMLESFTYIYLNVTLSPQIRVKYKLSDIALTVKC